MMTNATNRNPCKPPTIVTAIGKSKKYFNGIAISNKTKYEIPSKIPEKRKTPTELLNTKSTPFSHFICLLYKLLGSE